MPPLRASAGTVGLVLVLLALGSTACAQLPIAGRAFFELIPHTDYRLVQGAPQESALAHASSMNPPTSTSTANQPPASTAPQTPTSGVADFNLEVTPEAAAIAVREGASGLFSGNGTATFTVSIQRINGFDGVVFLTAETSRPGEAQPSFDPALGWLSPGGRDQAKLQILWGPLYGRPPTAVVNVTVVAEALGGTLRHTKSVTVNVGTSPERPPRPAPQGTSDATTPAGPVPTNPNSPATVSAGTPTINKPPTPRFALPSRFMLQPVSGAQTNAFGQGHITGGVYNGGHTGIDIIASRGTLVLAAAPGTVVLVKQGDYARAAARYGNYIVIDHHNGFLTLYAHLDSVAAGIDGKEVTHATRIGSVGMTGAANGVPHLHFEILNAVPEDDGAWGYYYGGPLLAAGSSVDFTGADSAVISYVWRGGQQVARSVRTYYNPELFFQTSSGPVAPPTPGPTIPSPVVPSPVQTPTPTPTPPPTPRPAPAPTPTPPVTPSAPPTLRIDDSTSSSRQPGQAFSFRGSGYTAGRPVTRYVSPAVNGSILLTPAVTADAAGNISWSFTPACGGPTNTFTIYAVDDATGRRSNTVTETITANPMCDPPTLRIDGRTSSSRQIGQAFSFTGNGYTAGRTVTRYINPPVNGSTVLGPTLMVDGSGNISWSFTPACGSPINTFTIYAVDDATGRRSNNVSETVNTSPSCR